MATLFVDGGSSATTGTERTRNMGKASRTKRERGIVGAPRGVAQVTHEPMVPVNWPEGHVRVELTDAAQDECIVVTIHGVAHYLHSTTARELEKALAVKLDEWNQINHAGQQLFGLDKV
jgi:hypothetical protein